MTAERKKELKEISKEIDALKMHLEDIKGRLTSIYEDEDDAFRARTDRYCDSIEYEVAEETCTNLYQAEYYIGTSIGDIGTALDYIESALDY